jgi:DNA replication protein DnaC
MLTHSTLDKLESLRLFGMANALREQMQMHDIEELAFEERMGLLVDREMTERENRRLKTRLKKAHLRHKASVEDIDFRHPRGLDRSVVMQLTSCQWIEDHLNCLIVGPTGVGKSFLACALTQKACREGYTALYVRVPKLFQDLAIARGDGRYVKLFSSLAKMDLLALDDFGLRKLTEEQRHDLLELFEDRHGRRSTLITSQLDVEHWHEIIGDPTLADAILDRLVHSAYRMDLKGESMRKQQSTLV